MKRFLYSASFLCLTVLLVSGCGSKEGSDTDEVALLSLPELLEQAETLVDKQIAVSGTVTHVCRHGGKRLHLTDTETNDRLRIELGEGMSGFARDLEGYDIVVTGILRELRIDEDYLNEWEQEILAEHAELEEHGEECDPNDLDAVNARRKELAESGKAYLSIWHLESLSYKMKDGSTVPIATDHDDHDHDHDHDHSH